MVAVIERSEGAALRKHQLIIVDVSWRFWLTKFVFHSEAYLFFLSFVINRQIIRTGFSTAHSAFPISSSPKLSLASFSETRTKVMLTGKCLLSPFVQLLESRVTANSDRCWSHWIRHQFKPFSPVRSLIAAQRTETAPWTAQKAEGSGSMYWGTWWETSQFHGRILVENRKRSRCISA